MSALHRYKHLLLSLPLSLLSSQALALLAEGGVISGMEPNTVVELDLGLAAPATATTNARGEVIITEEEDDDPGTLYIPSGSDGKRTLSYQDSGDVIGVLAIDGARVTVASVGAAAITGNPLSYDEGDLRFFVEAGFASLNFNNIANNTAAGRGLAELDGFTTRGSADRDAMGGSIGFGLAVGDGMPWTSKGSHQWQMSLGYSWYEDFEGQFYASQPGINILSSGEQEAEALRLSVAYEYFLTDGIGLSASLGWERYETEDSGNIVRLDNGEELSRFSESNSDNTGTAGFGLSYWPTHCLGLRASYRYSFSDVGGGDTDEPGVFGLDAILTF
tara:strand:- start:135 stop:1130 length:996 start_codon:yes stop_codon:yes gene_type:complete